MCRRIDCQQCGKPSYAGCGAHIEQVLGDVPKPQRCQCREAAAAKKQQTQGASWVDRFLKR